MIVVSNTSPLTNLAAIGQFDILRQLYATIHIAEGVWDELHANGQAWPGYAEVAAARWIERHPVQQPVFVNLLCRDLDRGEAETIALAIEFGAEMVLIDEQEGRHAAQRLGLKVVGVVAVLLEAKAHHILSHIRPSLDALRYTAGFYLKDSFYQTALALANEIPASGSSH